MIGGEVLEVGYSVGRRDGDVLTLLPYLNLLVVVVIIIVPKGGNKKTSFLYPAVVVVIQCICRGRGRDGRKWRKPEKEARDDQPEPYLD